MYGWLFCAVGSRTRQPRFSERPQFARASAVGGRRGRRTVAFVLSDVVDDLLRSTLDAQRRESPSPEC